MLLVVINHKQPKNEQSGNNAADQFAEPMKIPKGAGKRTKQKKGR
jgi:hypothetical protein